MSGAGRNRGDRQHPYETSFTACYHPRRSVLRNHFQATINTDVNTNRLTTAQAIEKNRGLLRPYTYTKPERINSLELGYKGLLLNQKLYADVYCNVHRNFMALVEAKSLNSF